MEGPPFLLALSTGKRDGSKRKEKTDWSPVSKPFEAEACLNVIYEFSPYLKENTTLHHYKDQLVNAV
jgi:hypothetical protein